VRSNDNIQGTLTQPAGETAIDVRNKYTDWLPNANLNVHFGRDVILRLAATKTRTRPQFSDLNPALSLDAPNTSCDPTTQHCVRTGTGGNPFLKPFTSANYDASLEYYFSPTGYATVGVFHRNIKGFIATETFDYPNPDPVTGFPLEITGPVNTDKGKIDGFEAQVRTFFDWGFMPSWARSFGIDANVTHLKASAIFQIVTDPGGHPGGFFIKAPLTDVSNWAYNLTGMYERGPLSVRLSYNWRGPYPEGGFANNPGFTLQGRAHPSPRLDLSTSYNLTKNVSLFFDWTNITGKPFTSDIVRRFYDNTGTLTGTEVFPMIVRFEERILSGGVRFNFEREHTAAPVFAPPPMALPPAAVQPVVEQPAPPLPPPAPVERGERGN